MSNESKTTANRVAFFQLTLIIFKHRLGKGDFQRQVGPQGGSEEQEGDGEGPKI